MYSRSFAHLFFVEREKNAFFFYEVTFQLGLPAFAGAQDLNPLLYF